MAHTFNLCLEVFLFLGLFGNLVRKFLSGLGFCVKFYNKLVKLRYLDGEFSDAILSVCSFPVRLLHHLCVFSVQNFDGSISFTHKFDYFGVLNVESIDTGPGFVDKFIKVLLESINDFLLLFDEITVFCRAFLRYFLYKLL